MPAARPWWTSLRTVLAAIRPACDATGVFVQIDHVGRPASAGTQPEAQRARNVVQVVRAGHLDQVLLSMDICANSQLHWNGGHGYDYLIKEFVPLLYHEGLTEAEVRTLLIDNPRRALAF